MGQYLSAPVTDKATKSYIANSKKLICAHSSMQGWRINMEDAEIAQFDIEQDIHIFGVFDGHGGKEVAQYVKKNFISELLKNTFFKKEDYSKALQDTFLKMDQLLMKPGATKELQKLANSQDTFDSESTAGCTANVVLMVKNTLYIANAGDSRCVLSQNGAAVALSQDHKPDQPSERDRIVAAGGFVQDGRVNANLNLSRAIGDLEFKKNKNLSPEKQLIIAKPDVKVQNLKSSDEFFVIGCDGVWETYDNQYIIDFIAEKFKKNISIENICESLLDILLAKDTSIGHGLDNMTLVIVKLKN